MNAVSPQLQPNLEDAKAFIKALEPSGTVTFTPWPENSQGGATAAMHGTLDDLSERLTALNQNGSAIGLMVNAGDGKGAKTQNVKQVRALFADFDEGQTPPNPWPLEPHLIVDSSAGKCHAYWLVEDCPLDAFTRFQKAISTTLGSDPSVTNLSRIMRLAGFWHCKSAPFQTRLIANNDLAHYSLVDIIDGLKLQPALDALDKATPEPIEATNTGGDVGEGYRHGFLTKEARTLKGHGLAGEALYQALEGINTARCNPPISDPHEVRNIAKWATQNIQYDAFTNEPREWSTPQPLSVTTAPEPFPLDALPATIKAAIEEVAGFVQAPVPLVASSALATLSLAIQAHYDVKRAERLQGPTGLFLLTIADSGERKSSCDGYFSQAIREYEAKRAEEAEPHIKRYEAECGAWEAKRSGIKDKIRQLAKKGSPVAEQEAALRALEEEKPKRPRVPRLVYADATPEALAHSLAKQWPSGGVLSAEAGSVLGSHGMGKDSVMRNLATLNQLWDGATLTVDRRTSDSFTVKGARLTVALQVQEPTLREFFSKSGTLARGTGFLARFLIAWPQSTQGQRFFKEPPESWPALSAFNRRLSDILNQLEPIDEHGALEPCMLSLSPQAKRLWVNYHDAIEVELKTSGDLYDVRDVASKSADNAARLAALFQVFEHGGGAITEAPFNSASRIAAWSLSEARRFFGELALPTELADAARLDDWLLLECKRTQTESINKRHARQYGPLRDGARLDNALKELDDLDRVRVHKDGRRVVVEVNPSLLREAA